MNVPAPIRRDPTVRLAYGGSVSSMRTLSALSSVGRGYLPGLLVSYVYLGQFERNIKDYEYRDWVMDSGAFSAHTIGLHIDLQAYIEKAKELLAGDSRLVEVFALDVIGDWKAGLANTERMWEAGVQAVPCYHYGEPESVLLGLAKDYPKIALGGGVGMSAKLKLEWARQCFARVWPKKVHGFGFGSESMIMALPWHSTDATNWEIGPLRYGRWCGYGGESLGLRGGAQNLRVQIDHYLRIEDRAANKWAREMAQLEVCSGG